MKTALLFLWNTLLRLQRIVMLLTMCITTLAVFLEVIMRYIFKTPLVGIEELAAYVAFWLYFIGGSYGSYERSHISADMSSLIFKDRVSYARSHAVTSLITTGVCVYALPWAWEYFLWGYEMNEQSIATFMGSTYPVVYFQSSVLAGMVLMAFYFFVECCQWFYAGFIAHSVPDDMMSARKEIDSWIG